MASPSATFILESVCVVIIFTSWTLDVCRWPKISTETHGSLVNDKLTLYVRTYVSLSRIDQRATWHCHVINVL